MRTILLFVFFSLFAADSNAQHELQRDPEWINFARHLSEKKRFDDALFALNLIPGENVNGETLLMKGITLAGLSRYDSAMIYFSQALLKAKQDSIRNQAILFYNHCSIIEEKPLIIKEPENAYFRELLHLQEMAAALKKKDLPEFDASFNKMKCKNTDLAMIEFNLYLLSHEYRHLKKKSPFFAGLLSAVLPGSGKIYAGKPHEALNSFLPVVFNYAQAAEGFVKRKYKSPHFYVFGGIGTVFYFSNIYGSAKAVTRKYNERLMKVELKTDNELARLYTFY